MASPMSKMDGTRLPSTPWPFLDLYIYFRQVKMMMKNIASKSNLALVKKHSPAEAYFSAEAYCYDRVD